MAEGGSFSPPSDSKHTILKETIRALEDEIDKAYKDAQGSLVNGTETAPFSDSLTFFSPDQPSTPELQADSTKGESTLSYGGPSLHFDPDLGKDLPDSFQVKQAGLLSQAKRVTFNERTGPNSFTDTSRNSNSTPVCSSTPNSNTIRTPPPSYRSQIGSNTRVGEPKPVVMPEPYDGQSITLEDWLTNFELCSSINGWTETQKCTFLAVRLRGAALHVYTDLSANDRPQYSTVVQALQNRFDRTKQTDLYKVQLRSRVRRSNENLSELAGAIRRLANRAYPSVPQTVRDDIAKDQFLEALDSRNTRLQVRRNKPLVSLENKKAEVKQEVKAVCATSPSAGTQVKDQWDSRAHYEEINRKIEQLTKAVETLTEKHQKFKDLTCWSCGQKGHVKAKCKFQNKGTYDPRLNQSSGDSKPDKSKHTNQEN